MASQGLDNQLSFTLPEGVSINFVPAGLIVRASAYLIDFTIRMLIIVVLGMALSVFGKAGQGLLFILYFVVSWGYYIYFEGKNGQTPGKKKFNLQVVQDNGLPTRFSHIVLRNLLRAADAFPFFYITGLSTMALNKRFKRIGDWAAGTLVVYQEPLVKEQEKSEQVQVLAPKVQLTTEEQQTLISFAERSQSFSQARQDELAAILGTSLFPDQTEKITSEQLKALAKYYAGQAI